VNPYGYEIYRPALELRRIVRMSYVPNPEWLRPPPADFPWFYGLLGITLFVLIFSYRKVRDFRMLFLAALFSGLALTYLRNVGFFALSSVFVLSGPLSRTTESGRRGGAFLWMGLTLTLLSSYFGFSDGKSYGLGWKEGRFPFREVDFIEEKGIRGRIFTEVIFGDYLIYRQYPGQRVFIDGRNEIHEALLREIFAGLESRSTDKWSAFLAKYDLDIALLRYPPTLQGVIYSSGGRVERGYRAFSTVYFPKKEWALVYWDDAAMVFVKRVPKFEDLISSCEYKIVHPDDWKYQLEAVRAGRLDRQGILQEIRRKLRENPDCRRASRLLALFSRE
jgi:hypothetical protein